MGQLYSNFLSAHSEMSFTVFLAMLESVLVSKQPFLLLLMYCGYANYTHTDDYQAL